MALKTIVSGLILAYFLILLHFAINVNGEVVAENEGIDRESQSHNHVRFKRQIPFLSNWWTGSSSTSRPSEYNKRYGQGSSYHSKYHNSDNSIGQEFSSFRKPNLYNDTATARLPSSKEVSERDPRCKKYQLETSYLP
jgi:hypothetical protein